MKRYFIFTKSSIQFICTVYILFINSIAFAQEYKQTIGYSVKSVDAQNILGYINKQTAILLNTDTGYVVKLFNYAMAETATITPKYLQNNIADLFVQANNNELQTIYTKPANYETKYLYMAKYNASLALAINPYIIDSLPINKGTSNLQFIKSKNNAYTVAWYEQIITDDSMDIYYNIIFDNKASGFKKVGLGKFEHKFINKIEISNTGILAIINCAVDKKANTTQTNCYLPQLQNSLVTLSPSDAKHNNNLIFSVNNFNNTLHVIHWQTTVENGVLGLQYSIINLADGSLLRNQETNVLNTNSELQYANTEEGIFLPKQLLFTGAQNCILVSEYFGHEIFQQGASNFENGITFSPMGQRLNRTIHRYTAGNILITTIADSNNLSYAIIRKEQVSEGEPNPTASYAMAVLPNALQFVYNKIDRYGNIETNTLLTNGQSASNLYESSAKYEGTAIFDQFKQISNTAIIVPCAERGEVSYLKISFP